MTIMILLADGRSRHGTPRRSRRGRPLSASGRRRSRPGTRAQCSVTFDRGEALARAVPTIAFSLHHGEHVDRQVAASRHISSVLVVLVSSHKGNVDS